MLLVGLGLFAVTSLLCAAAQSPGQLVAARFVQGLSAAMLAPQVLASIHSNTEGHHLPGRWTGAARRCSAPP
ncbi:hypothetical protein [Nocardioides sp.]|uniref:hypothetical protein n=1 Tax=Nocardioides sp. TaxID=35761 RepID=UPI0039E5AFF6